MLRDGVIQDRSWECPCLIRIYIYECDHTNSTKTNNIYNTDLCKGLQRRVSSSSLQKFIFKWLKKVMLLFYEMKIEALKRQLQNVTVSNSTNAGPRTKILLINNCKNVWIEQVTPYLSACKYTANHQTAPPKDTARTGTLL